MKNNSFYASPLCLVAPASKRTFSVRTIWQIAAAVVVGVFSTISTIQAGIFVGGICENGLINPTTAQWQQEIDAVRNAAGWIRISVNWADIQPAATTPVANWNWSLLDAKINYARPSSGKKLSVLLQIGDTPGWANNNAGWGGPPINQYDLQYFCYQVAYRYMPLGCVTYEIYNEVNMVSPGWPTPNGGDYFNLFVWSAWAGIDNANTVLGSKGYTLILGSLNSWSTYVDPVTFLTQVYQTAGSHKSFWQAVAYHPYAEWWNGVPSQMPRFSTIPEQLHNVMNTYGDGAKRIWATEYGVPCSGSGVGVTENSQVAFVNDAVWAWYSKSYNGPLFWYSIQDRQAYGYNNDTENYYGLLRSDFSYKPAYNFLKCWFY